MIVVLRYKRLKNVTETYTRRRAPNKIPGHFSRLLAQSLVHSTLTQRVLKSNERESRRTGNAQEESKGHRLQALARDQSLKFTLELAVETVSAGRGRQPRAASVSRQTERNRVSRKPIISGFDK